MGKTFPTKLVTENATSPSSERCGKSQSPRFHGGGNNKVSGISICFSRFRLQKPALYLHKEHGTVCTPPCLRKRSFVLQDGAPCWSLHPPPALNISSPTLGMSAISQKSFIPDFNPFIFIRLHI
ncbi:hypothetical protein T03_8388 [Trichinella britovi]|uniref:Uncharacterized protein n=1 Tax=Trichinella britovi TaxID=45882 RepID=A0A0V1CRJ1_TRIBR|nr:hypothetical protein T03_8388 [Trichinella britovi]